MANEAQLEVLEEGVEAWNAWRRKHPRIREPDLSFASLPDDLDGVDFRGVDLRGVVASGASLRGADLSHASLIDTVLSDSDLDEADLREAFMHETDLSGANLRSANLGSINTSWASMNGACLDGANLAGASLEWCDLSGASLEGADLRGADLSCARLVATDLSKALLTGARVYGVSAWGVGLADAEQKDLIVTQPDEPVITVDDLELAHFVYQILKNGSVRRILDTVTLKSVLLLGRFTPQRKQVLYRIRDRLREAGYSPVVFDFAGPEDRDLTETITTLARLCRFIVADLTDPSSIPKELEAIAPRHAVPIQPLIEGEKRPYAMFKDNWKYDWVLGVNRYANEKTLMEGFDALVVQPAEAKVAELANRKARGANRGR
jgi:uncharacterized protein YjbI with pentapeptide repeats